ncbi:hypothetical protein NFJ02_23g53650 [Pycnococcus provasolii]
MEDEHAWYAAVERVLEKPSSAEANTNVIVQRAVTFPQCLGVNLAGRWRWPLPGVRVTAGARCAPAKTNAADQTSSTEPNGLHDERTNGNGENGTHGSSSAASSKPRRTASAWRRRVANNTTTYARVRLTRPLFGKAAVTCEWDVDPTAGVTMRLRREFKTSFGHVTLATWGRRRTQRKDARAAPTAGVQFNLTFGSDELRVCELRTTSSTVESDPGVGTARVVQPIMRHADAVVETDVFLHDGWISAGNLAQLKERVSVRGARLALARSMPHSVRSERAEKVVTTFNRNLLGTKRTIGVIPGHWIDAGLEVGAPGERKFNLEVANRIESKLKNLGWSVLRPDRNAKGLEWDDYLDWITSNSKRGVPVLEIHGQGDGAKSRSVVLGVIGDPKAPLNRRLAETFGFFPMNHMHLAVPRRGGVIIESFNADMVLSLTMEQRRALANDIALKVTDSVESTVRRVDSKPSLMEDGCSMTGCDTGIK